MSLPDNIVAPYRGDTAESLRGLAPERFNRTALCYHYSHMAKRNAREYLYEGQVRLKKYFYVLRPLLAIRYIETGRGIPPVRFDELVDAMAQIESMIQPERAADDVGWKTAALISVHARTVRPHPLIRQCPAEAGSL